MKLRALFLFCIAVLSLPTVTVAQTRTANAPRPQCIITASPGAVVIGNTVTLSWSSQNATGGTITSIGTVAPSGTQGVIPTARSHTYVGAFTGPGGSVNCSVEVGILQFTGGGSIDRGGVAGSGVAPLAPSAGEGGAALRPTGLLPCTGINCQACHLAGLAQNIINWLVGISIPLAAAMFAYAGILYFSSSVAGRLDDAHKIFKNVGIGFLIVICSWLVIQTVLKTILAPKFYQSWNNIACVDESLRPKNRAIQDMLGLIGGRMNTNVSATLPPNYGTNYTGNLNGVSYDTDTGCSYGSRWNATLGGCENADGEIMPPIGFAPANPYTAPSSYTQCYGEDVVQDGYCLGAEGSYPPYAQTNASSGPEGSCKSGYRYAEDAEYAWCQGPGGVEDIIDFQSTPRGGPVLQCALGAEGCGDISAATTRYFGTDTSAGPDRGNLACAWSVNNILRDAGIAPIDGNAVQSMRDELDNGRGERVSFADAREGDIIVWQGIGANGRRVSHVGFCENDTCTDTSSNNSTTARYGMNAYGQTLNGVVGVVYRVNR